MKKLLSIAMCLCLAFSIVGCDKEDNPDNGGNNNGGNNGGNNNGTSTEKTYSIGDYYNVGGVKGIVYKITNGGKNGKIISMDKGANLAWHSHDGNGYFLVGASSLVNGKVNMEAIKACDLPLSDFPIFKWCEDKNTGGVTGWYLPSWDEALEIAKSYQVLQTSLQSNGGSTFSSNYVWSSSEKDDDEAYYIDMKNKDSDKHWKNFSDGFDARAIKEF